MLLFVVIIINDNLITKLLFFSPKVHERLSAAQIIAKVAHEGLRPKIPLGCPLAHLMAECWKQEPTERPDFDVIVNALNDIYEKASSHSSKPVVTKDDSCINRVVTSSAGGARNSTTPGFQHLPSNPNL